MAKKSQKPQKERLFEEKLVPAKPGSGELFDGSIDAAAILRAVETDAFLV